MPSASLLLLALAAPQAPVQVTVAATVNAAGSSVSDPTLASAAPGDSVLLRFQVETPGTLFGASQLDIFTIVEPSIGLSVGSASFAGGISLTGCIVSDQLGGGSGDKLQVGLDLTPTLRMVLNLTDSSSDAWASVDIADNFGTYAASVFDTAFFQVEDGGGVLQFDVQSLSIGPVIPGIGMPFCGPAVANSSGLSGELVAFGSPVAMLNDLALTASSLPLNTFGIFIVSRDEQMPAPLSGSVGNLCLSGAIGRYFEANQILSTGQTGRFTLPLDLTRTPEGNGFVAIAAGDTWRFQGWHRDLNGGTPTSNLTPGLAITFQ